MDKTNLFIIPAKAGTHQSARRLLTTNIRIETSMGPGFRRDDET